MKIKIFPWKCKEDDCYCVGITEEFSMIKWREANIECGCDNYCTACVYQDYAGMFVKVPVLVLNE